MCVCVCVCVCVCACVKSFVPKRVVSIYLSFEIINIFICLLNDICYLYSFYRKDNLICTLL